MKLEASGSVEGVLTDDMAMSEYQGNLRIATTKTAYGIEKVTDDIDGEIIGYDTQESTTYNQLYILGKNLKIKGKIENLAKGEEIYAVRFLGNTGYVVTFRQTDPLFSIDLSDPKKPKVLGKLKISGFSEYLHGYGEGMLLGLGMETMIVSLCMKIMSVLITVILYGRMIEIYLYVSVAPVPCATVTNREWGTIGTNYFKGLCALAFQGFFMMVCVAIYAVLVAGVAVSENLHTALWSVAAYTVILCFSLFKTGSLSKSIWNAH